MSICLQKLRELYELFSANSGFENFQKPLLVYIHNPGPGYVNTKILFIYMAWLWNYGICSEQNSLIIQVNCYSKNPNWRGATLIYFLENSLPAFSLCVWIWSEKEGFE